MTQTIFEMSSSGRVGSKTPQTNAPKYSEKNGALLRGEIEGFPELSEVDVVRHFTNLSQKNFGVDGGFYPLGSCTMKYNPKINEELSRLSSFTSIHPLCPEKFSLGTMELLYRFKNLLKTITEMDDVTLAPAAGAHGELTGMLLLRAYFKNKKESRTKIIVPTTAHGTNPASVALAGFSAVSIPCNEKGITDPKDVEKAMGSDVAGIMLTNPNTLGLFEENILQIAKIVHGQGGLVYCDGANFNALIGKISVKKMGVDILHLNLHKSFSTPHGGGGPGSGPVCINKILSEFLPKPQIEFSADKGYFWNYNIENSIGKVSTFYGNIGVIIKAYCYLLSIGSENLSKISEMAVLNANYIMHALKDSYHLPYDRTCMHECVFTDKIQSQNKITTLDIAKRLIDYGFHPPTIYFPLVVHGAIMIEPTETESKQTIDSLIAALKEIAKEVQNNPELLKNAPTKAPVTRLDEVLAAKNPMLCR